MLDAALWYASHKWPVFPCAARGKEPVIPRAEGGRGVYDASTKPEQVRAWWGRWPDANIGLAIPAEYAVIDLDSAEAIEVLRAEGWTLPATACSRTARGWHYLYSLPPGSRLRNGATALEHVEIKTVGGYIMVPPSVHPSGVVYRWVTVPKAENIAPAPEWLVGLAAPADGVGKARPSGEWAVLIRGPVLEGHRRGELLRLGGLLFRRLPAEVAFALGHLWARASCTPPIDESEVDRILGDVAALELRRCGGES